MSQLLDAIFPKYSIVAYDPGYLDPRTHEPIREIGVVSSTNDTNVFVKFTRELDYMENKWDAVIAKSCKPEQLILIQKGEIHEDMAPQSEG